MRRPRRLRPQARWFVTVRCIRAQFRLRPDTVRRQTVGFFLGRALHAHPGIALHSVVQMSNHLHLVLTDEESELDRFMARFLGPLAKAMNAEDGVSGPFFERRYAATEILDDEALLDRITYVATNPVAADLVEAVEDWPGLCLWPGAVEGETFTRFHAGAYARALARRGAAVDRSEFELQARIELRVPNLLGRSIREELRSAVRLREARLRAARGRKRVLGARRVLSLSVFASPERPARSPMPLCHASSSSLWRSFREEWTAFVRAYREASERYRAGQLHVPFPAWSFRPSVPILS